jgi:hypothetical protein
MQVSTTALPPSPWWENIAMFPAIPVTGMVSIRGYQQIALTVIVMNIMVRTAQTVKNAIRRKGGAIRGK